MIRSRAGKSRAAVRVPLAGIAQPMFVPGWNPKGDLDDGCHRAAVCAA